MKQPIIMRDGSPAEDEDMSFWYDEKDERTLDKVMDFSETFPYWQELKRPEGFMDVEKIGEVWFWIIKEPETV